MDKSKINEALDLVLRVKDTGDKVKFAREKFLHCCRFENQEKREEARTELLILQEAEVNQAAEMIDMEKEMKTSALKDLLRRGR